METSGNRWTDLWQRLGVTAPSLAAAGASVALAYGETARFYHNITHLMDVLEKLDWAKDALDVSGELAGLGDTDKKKLFDTVELALWYHDAVYDAKAKDNEARSRDLFLSHAQKFGLADPLQKEIAALIDLTAHHRTAKTLPECILVDCDLAILGAPKAEFDAYDRNIRKEYAHVPEPLYKKVRRGVLKGFLNQPQIFKTAAFRARFEEQARVNLKAATAGIFSRLFG